MALHLFLKAIPMSILTNIEQLKPYMAAHWGPDRKHPLGEQWAMENRDYGFLINIGFDITYNREIYFARNWAAISPFEDGPHIAILESDKSAAILARFRLKEVTGANHVLVVNEVGEEAIFMLTLDNNASNDITDATFFQKNYRLYRDLLQNFMAKSYLYSSESKNV